MFILLGKLPIFEFSYNTYLNYLFSKKLHLKKLYSLKSIQNSKLYKTKKSLENIILNIVIMAKCKSTYLKN